MHVFCKQCIIRIISVNKRHIIQNLYTTCIYMYCNIERTVMKNQSGSPSFGI